MKTITVREYAKLTTKPIEKDTLDEAHLTSSAFNWLCELYAKWSKKSVAFIDIEGTQTLRLNNYVGILETPCGTSIEILPKTYSEKDDKEKEIKETRNILWRMITIYMGKDIKEADLASIKCSKKPLTEWLIHIYLQELALLLKKGLHAQYNRVEEERTFIRGQINVSRQMRQPAHKQHLTHVRHNIFSADRAENRILRTALYFCHKSTRDSENWMLATQLLKMMEQIPPSINIKNDMRLWQKARHMTHYEKIKPWCTLILQNNIPTAMYDTWKGISLLFPMEKLFEAFVKYLVSKKSYIDIKLTSPKKKEYLCTHNKTNMFDLQSDILLESEGKKWVLDAKWKKINHSKNDNFGISQSDMYQLFAYGHKYLDGKGEMALIYPKTDDFQGIEEPFYFTDEMKLYVIACDIENEIFLPACSLGDFPFSP